MSVLLLDFEYLQHKKLFLDLSQLFTQNSDNRGLVLIINKEVYENINNLPTEYRLEFIKTEEFKESIFYILPFTFNKIKKSIHLEFLDFLKKWLGEVMEAFYQNFPHNYKLVLRLKLDDERFTERVNLICKYFSYPLLDGEDLSVYFFKVNDHQEMIGCSETITLVEKLLLDYHQMIDKDVDVINCKILVNFEKETILQLKNLSSKVFELKNQFMGLELSDKFSISKITEKEDNTLVTLKISNLEQKIGDGDSVDVVYSKYTYHTHPRKTYQKFEVNLAWPSYQDFESFIILFLNGITLMHLTSTLEGAYVTTINPNFLPYLGDYDNDDYAYICEKYYNLEYPSYDIERRKKMEGVFTTPKRFLDYVNKEIKIEYKKMELPPLFHVNFIDWKEFNEKIIFVVSFYSEENKSCQIADIQNLK